MPIDEDNWFDLWQHYQSLAKQHAAKEAADREHKLRMDAVMEGIKRTLFGLKGDNGLVGDNIRHGEELKSLWKRMAALDDRVQTLEEDEKTENKEARQRTLDLKTGILIATVSAAISAGITLLLDKVLAAG